jgi:hypothetical protein
MKYRFLICFLFLSVALFAQSPDNYDISLEGHWVGDDNSDAAFQAHSIRVKVLSQPLDQGKNGILSIHATYDYIEMDFKDSQKSVNDLEHFHSAGLMFGYMKQLRNPKWSFMGMVIPQLNSNFTNGISGDDFYLNVLALLNYSKQKNTRFSMGLAYTNTLGFPAPIPVVNYWKAWNDKWEMNLGFPRVNLTRHFNQKNSLIAFAEIKGYNGNISKDINNPVFKANRTAQRISYRDVSSGLEWQYKLKKFMFKIDTGYTVSREFKLQDTDNDTAYKFDMSNNFNIGLGIGFDL